MINTYREYLSLVKDIERERKEESYCRSHGFSLPPERFSLLTAILCFAGEEAYSVLLEDIFYENISSISFPPEDFFVEVEEEDEYDAAMQEELLYWQYARMLGWE